MYLEACLQGESRLTVETIASLQGILQWEGFSNPLLLGYTILWTAAPDAVHASAELNS